MNKRKSKIIAISGISGAGKTQTIRNLQKKLPECAIILFDMYKSNNEEFVREIKKTKEKGEYSFIIIEDPIGMSESITIINPDYRIYINIPLEIGLTRVLLRAIYNSSDKGINDFYATIGPQFEHHYSESPTKLMHIIVWLLESYLERHRQGYIEDGDRMKKQADLVVDGMNTTKEIVDNIVTWIESH